MRFDRRLIQNFDWILLLTLVFLTVLSIVNLFSATHALREVERSQVFTKQIYWFLIGFAAFFAMTTFNYKVLAQWAYPLYLIAVALLILVLFAGRVTSGSQRWLSLGPFSVQPSELAKMGLLLVLAKFFSKTEGRGQYKLRELWFPAILLAAPAGLILKQPDLGTALLLVLFSFSLGMVVRIHWGSLFILFGSGFALAPFLWSHLKEYQKMRILSFLRPDLDPLGAGYHINQSKIAIGSGQFWGKGFLKGTQTRLHFLPEQHTDFAFSVFAEEWGFAGSLILLLVYLFLILRGIQIARNSNDKFGSMIAVGVMAIVFWQVAINVAMTTGLLPVVGIPLVLFSYGGSSLVTTMAGLGILMNIRMRRFMFQ